jgi:uncharacterized membrane protein (Fun14 family)
MISRLLITFFAWLVLMYVSINLVGLLVRGLFSNPEMEKLATEGSDFIKKKVKEHQRAEKKVNFIALALIAVYLIGLFHFWNVGVVVVAVMIMAARIPDLVSEIKHGRQNIKHASMADNLLTILMLVIMFVALPVLWYALYK